MAAEGCVGILGATGKLGVELVHEALARKYSVKAFVRNKEKMEQIIEETALIGRQIEIIELDMKDYKQFVPHLKGVGAILSSLGPSSLFTRSDDTSTIHLEVCRAMKETGIQKLIVCSCWGSGGRLEEDDGALFKFLVKFVSEPLMDHERSEQLITKFAKEEYSELKYSCIRTPRLTDGPRTELVLNAVPDRQTLIPTSYETAEMSRNDVARFFFDLAKEEDSQNWGKVVAVGLPESEFPQQQQEESYGGEERQKDVTIEIKRRGDE
eukprot:CAMPEP_0201488776 /NCGR_PEP_ID=MMETSP0151_2-20130828/19375_1 /ASSEMBLY_ACC=CAM_ASM_000257 /TAXON_ID=200890 /ORGANISM="Paramoeba atlantica, Strain 621/1 / CCAP 1560/9" /LENGTH=266 /DNA_ID=CAMNT_0047874133 /DNA_START=6 /DNA_END=803 /DNA_ORIENTATION=-